jgi:hypothetical protein
MPGSEVVPPHPLKWWNRIVFRLGAGDTQWTEIIAEPHWERVVSHAVWN